MPASLIGAGIGAVGSIASGSSGKKGANKAAQVQQQAYANQLAEQQRQFNVTQANLSPYVQAGNGALGAQQTLLGLNGNDAQGSAIDALKASPAFTSLFNTGNDAILQNAAATGALRGGNVQNSLANFGSSLLSTVIQNQLGNLGGLSSTGANAAAGLASAGQNSANAISNIYGQQGANQASNALAQSSIGNNTINGLQQSLQSLFASRQGLSGVSTGAAQTANLAGYAQGIGSTAALGFGPSW